MKQDKTSIFIADAEAMEALGASLISLCEAGGKVIFLHGNLGAGKTTVGIGFLRALGYQGAVKSPTYTVVESYELNGQSIHHFDLYRLNDPEELEELGIRDYLTERSICFFEWPERAKNYLPLPHISCSIDILAEGRAVVVRV